MGHSKDGVPMRLHRLTLSQIDSFLVIKSPNNTFLRMHPVVQVYIMVLEGSAQHKDKGWKPLGWTDGTVHLSRGLCAAIDWHPLMSSAAPEDLTRS
jgi:hypothetical protein